LLRDLLRPPAVRRWERPAPHRHQLLRVPGGDRWNFNWSVHWRGNNLRRHGRHNDRWHEHRHVYRRDNWDNDGHDLGCWDRHDVGHIYYGHNHGRNHHSLLERYL
jgi:hypothetical protein